MWIKCLTPETTEAVKVPGMDEAVEIPDSGVLQVAAEDGEALLEHPGYAEHSPDDGEDDGVAEDSA